MSSLLVARLYGIGPRNYSSKGTKGTFKMLLFHSSITRRTAKNRTSWSQSPRGTQYREVLVLNQVVHVTIEAAEQGIKTDNWRLGYALTVHSSQGLTLRSPQKVWSIDDYLQWSNLAYLAVSRVEHMNQLQRVTCPPLDKQEGTEVRQPS